MPTSSFRAITLKASQLQHAHRCRTAEDRVDCQSERHRDAGPRTCPHARGGRMKMKGATPRAELPRAPAPTRRGQLFRKYVSLFVTVVCAALVANGLLDIWFSFREQNRPLIRIQSEQAKATAANISQFIKEIEGQLAWATQLPW